MATVYRGEDPALGRSVAIKVLHPFVAARADGRGRFEREARAVAGLHHPNILQLHSAEVRLMSIDKKTLAFERLAGSMAEDGWLMLGAGETVIGQTSKLGADIKARGLYRIVGDGSRIEKDYGKTEVYHLAGFEMRTRDGHPESGSVGVLEWAEGDGTFAFVPDEELQPFTRHNWKWV